MPYGNIRNLAAAEAVVETNVGKRTMDAMRAVVARIDAREDALLTARIADAASSYRSAVVTRLLTTGFALLALALLLFATRRSGKDRLRVAEIAERLRVTLASIGDGVIVTDNEGRVSALNQVAERLTGWTNEDASGKPTGDVFRIVNESTRQSVHNPALRAMQEGVIVGLANHTVLIAKDGTERPIDDSGSPIKDATGDVIGSVLVFRDISERKRAEAVRERAEEAMREQHELLRLTLSSIGDAVVATNIDGVVTLLNPVAESLTGWQQKDAIGRRLREIFHIVNERTRREVQNPALRAMREGIIVGLANHSVLIAKDGTERPIDDAGAPIRTAEGKTVGAVLVFRDVSSRRKAEQFQAELFERERLARQNERHARLAAVNADQRLRLALEAGQMGTWQYTLRTGHVQWSPALEQMHGYKSGTFPGTWHAFRDRIHPEERDRVLKVIMEAINKDGDYQLEYRIVRPDGTIHWIEGRGHRFMDSEGQPEFMLGICVDITGRKHVEEADNHSRRAAEEANRAKDEFLAMVSHELRTPLNNIVGWSKLLRSEKLAPEQWRQALEVIERNAWTETQLVDSLLDISRITTGKLELAKEHINLVPLVGLVVEAFTPAAAEKGVIIEFQAAAMPITVAGDSTRLQQVVGNIISNAIKFTPRGGQVRLQLSRTDSHAQLDITDTGEGISPNFLPHVFERFKQGKSGETQYRKGLGLGLAIVDELIRAHTGTVTAASAGEGRGSTFTVRLPLSGREP